jgi:hypothetical protein
MSRNLNACCWLAEGKTGKEEKRRGGQEENCCQGLVVVSIFYVPFLLETNRVLPSTYNYFNYKIVFCFS